MCERARESGRGGKRRERVREVRFTHAPTTMPSWRVEYILYIIQDKNEHTHTHSQYAQVVCLRKRNTKGDQNIEIMAVTELLKFNFIGPDKHLLLFCHYIQLYCTNNSCTVYDSIVDPSWSYKIKNLQPVKACEQLCFKEICYQCMLVSGI